MTYQQRRKIFEMSEHYKHIRAAKIGNDELLLSFDHFGWDWEEDNVICTPAYELTYLEHMGTETDAETGEELPAMYSTNSEYFTNEEEAMAAFIARRNSDNPMEPSGLMTVTVDEMRDESRFKAAAWAASSDAAAAEDASREFFWNKVNGTH